MPGGAPEGNKNATKNRPIADALRRALLAEDGKKARELAEAMVAQAIAGDVAAAREVTDRTEGKVPQALEHSGPDGKEIPVAIKVSYVDAT